MQQLSLLDFAEPRAALSSHGGATVSARGTDRGPRRPAKLLSIKTLEREAERYVKEAHAPNTRKAYQCDWKGFVRWCAGQGRASLPASTATLALYLTHLANSGRKASSIRRARIAIGLAHGYAGAERPDRAESIRALERGIGRVHGTQEEGSAPLLERDVAAMVKVLGRSARDTRDRALILVGFAGAFRASELAALRIEHLTFTDTGLRVMLARSKEDQLGAGALTDIPFGSSEATCPVRSLQSWIARVGRSTGPLFRIVDGDLPTTRGIHPRAVSRAVQRATARAGLCGEYSAHSLRSGLATSAYAHGVAEREIQEHGRWKDRRSLDRYIRVAHIPGRKNAAAGLL